MVGGTVIETLVVPATIENDPESANFGRERPACVWIDVQDDRGRETCAIYVECTNESRSVSVGDVIWWQGRTAYWTPKSGAFKERELRRRGFSGVGRPTLTPTTEPSQ